jgi:hypothetical protein
MAMGEAAGTAAAMAIQTFSELRSVDVGTLQHVLRKNGAILQVPK